MRDTCEPAHDINDRPCLILELPVLSDEAALQLSELLQSLAEHFDTSYAEPIRRAYRARDAEREELYRERYLSDAQQSLPFNEILF